eukprot:7132809-Alexandrium_andersonii.AAC.1
MAIKIRAVGPSWKLLPHCLASSKQRGRNSLHFDGHPLQPTPMAFLMVQRALSVHKFIFLALSQSCRIKEFMPSQFWTSAFWNCRIAEAQAYTAGGQVPLDATTFRSDKYKSLNFMVLQSSRDWSASRSSRATPV